jgi:hypothetical protein
VSFLLRAATIALGFAALFLIFLAWGWVNQYVFGGPTTLALGAFSVEIAIVVSLF